ncbi:hypothetical protein PDJAM_G00201950 [Pangasius djambal]|uniref:Uncharacterized protein n=1 Tax=Pangasius djambal TaxID=1691987 RepID=A0ACC5Y8B6_9TELE|nr:hypothetical protein [Pangasius djambal]
MSESAHFGFLTCCAFVRKQRERGGEAEVSGAGRGAARGGPAAPQPIRDENADSKSCEQQRRQADRESKGADVPSSKNSASSGSRSTQPLKTYPKV